MRVLEVLLTGFKPCKSLSPNPSWDAIKDLDGVILKVNEELRLRVQAVELENAYTRLLETITTFYGLPPQWPPQDGPDDGDEIARRLSEQHFAVIVHIGGDDTRQIVSLEHDAPRWGYPSSNDYPVDGDDSKEATAGAPMDVDGRRGVVGPAWDHLGQGEDELLGTRIDADKVIASVRNQGFEHVQVGYGNGQPASLSLSCRSWSALSIHALDRPGLRPSRAENSRQVRYAHRVRARPARRPAVLDPGAPPHHRAHRPVYRPAS